MSGHFALSNLFFKDVNYEQEEEEEEEVALPMNYWEHVGAKIRV
jgi:hypothetical protein